MTDPSPGTQTIGARAVHQEATAALRPLLEGVRTVEELEDVLEGIESIKYVLPSTFGILYMLTINCRRARVDAANEGQIFDPPTLNPKGRPRTARITGRLEGRLRGGGPTGPAATVRRRRCGLCREEGHKRTNCPFTRGPGR